MLMQQLLIIGDNVKKSILIFLFTFIALSGNAYSDVEYGAERIATTINLTQVSYCELACLLDEESTSANAEDASPNERDRLQNGTPEIATGKFGGARVINDADNAYFVGDESIAFSSTSHILVMGWVKSDGGNGTILNVDTIIVLRVDGDNAQFILDPFSTNDRVSGSTTVNDNTFHHLAGFYDGSKIYIYVDGVDDSSGGLTPTGDWGGTSTDDWTFGRLGSDEYDGATLDEMAVFSNTDDGISTKAKIEAIITNAFSKGLEGNG